MSGRPAARFPYGLTMLIALGLITAAWVSRGRFQPVAAGTEAPDFAYPTLVGDTMRLSDLEGSVVLVNVWATWCLPCRQEMPSMQRVYDQMRSEGLPFEILAVSVDAGLGISDRSGNVGGDVRGFAREYDLDFPILLNPRGEIQATYQTTGVPESFLVGRDGVIYRKIAGATEWDQPSHTDLIRRLMEGDQ